MDLRAIFQNPRYSMLLSSSLTKRWTNARQAGTGFSPVRLSKAFKRSLCYRIATRFSVKSQIWRAMTCDIETSESNLLTITIAGSKNSGHRCSFGHQLIQYKRFPNRLYKIGGDPHQNYQIIMGKYHIVGAIRHPKLSNVNWQSGILRLDKFVTSPVVSRMLKMER
jgi:hypothetical protein